MPLGWLQLYQAFQQRLPKAAHQELEQQGYVQPGGCQGALVIFVCRFGTPCKSHTLLVPIQTIHVEAAHL